MSCFVLGFSRRPRVSSFQPLRCEQVGPHHRAAVPQHNGFTQGSSANGVCQRKSRHGKTTTNVSAIFSCYKMLSVMPSCVNTKQCCSFILRVRYSSCCGFQPVECIIVNMSSNFVSGHMSTVSAITRVNLAALAKPHLCRFARQNNTDRVRDISYVAANALTLLIHNCIISNKLHRWRCGVAVGCRTRYQEVAGSSLGRAPWHKTLSSFSHRCASDTKQYNLVLA